MIAFDTIEAPGANPDRICWILHGILGAGRNWRSFARRLVKAHPRWRIVTPDLRNHGETGSKPPPHRLDSCVEDLDWLPEPDLVIGHSFGGKVALAWAEARGTADTVWVLDSIPVSLPDPADQDDIATVIQALRSVPTPAPSRSEARAVLLAKGLPPFQVDWLLTSFAQQGKGWQWVYDLDGVEAMMRDYFARDFSDFLADHPGAPEIKLVRASRSVRWTEDVLSRLQLGAGVTLDILPDADHWLHVDNPEGLLELLAPSFRT